MIKIFRSRDLEKRIIVLEHVADSLIDVVKTIVEMEKKRGGEVDMIKEVTNQLNGINERVSNLSSHPETAPYSGEPYHH